MSDAHSAVTLQDVASHAGVSLATASRALNGSSRKVRADLQEKVRASAAALNYTPNAHAQAVARGRTNVLGLIVHDIADPYFSSIAAGVMAAAEREDLLVTLASTNRSLTKEIQHVAALRAQRAGAVILAGSRTVDDDVNDAIGTEISAFMRGGGRVVAISQPILEADTIVIENRQAALDLAVELVDRGYQRHAILAGPATFLTARDRVDGYLAGLATRGLAPNPEHVLHGEFTRDGGYDAVRSLAEHLDDVDCIFAVNDVMAVGAIAALRDLDKSVPADVAVAGFDDIVTLRDVAPGLTTVRVPLREIGELAFRLAAGDAADRAIRRHVKGEVVIRESTPYRR